MRGQVVWYPGMTLDTTEKLIILEAYEIHLRNKTSTANALGISIRTLDQRLERYKEEQIIYEDKLRQEELKRIEMLARARGNPPNNQGITYDPIVVAQNNAAHKAHMEKYMADISEKETKHSSKIKK